MRGEAVSKEGPGGSGQQEDIERKRAVLERFLAQEHTDLLRVLKTYARKIYSTPGEREENARELLTQTAKVLLEKAPEFDLTQSPRPFFMRIASNIIKQMIEERGKSFQRHISVDSTRDIEREGEFTDLWERLAISGRPGNDPAKTTVGELWVAETLSHLSESDRKLIEMSVINTMSGEEIAEILGINHGAVRVRISRAMEKLRKAVASESDVVLAGRRNTQGNTITRNSQGGHSA
jgi:RNA polymerase sigma factor (sigma-70 family)